MGGQDAVRSADLRSDEPHGGFNHIAGGGIEETVAETHSWSHNWLAVAERSALMTHC